MKHELPKFLTNTPIGEDLFEGKSQEKIADVLVKILEDEKFQIIGIDGTWGTGKSNLVKIIEKKITGYKFFIYDVWGHQEDDQRKAILVELTEFISDKKNNIVSNSDTWKDKLKFLLSKQKEVTTINRPYLSIGFIFSLFSIIYVPTVSTLKDTIPNYFNITDTFWKLFLVLFPIFIVIGIYITNFILCLFKKEGLNSFKLAAQKTFQVYTNKQEQETKVETTSENEPSVQDFRKWMKNIDKDLINNKLVLVFDNFDRLPKKHILSIWSSIHIFFSEEKYKNIKVIIPFDRSHIKNAFVDLNSKDPENDFASDYISKTFDLVYRVSPPILSDWKIFFRNKWNDAFGEVDEEEYLKVEQIYEVYRPNITPREIIACINEIVSIRLLNDSVPDRYIALFVLNKEAILQNPLKAIIDHDFLKGLTYLYGGDEKFQKYITSLSYQINPENALEVIYKKQLKDSLVNNEGEQFLKISKTDIFSKIVLSTVSELENFDYPILVFNSLNDESKLTDVERRLIWEHIYLKTLDRIVDDFSISQSEKILLTHLSINNCQERVKHMLSKLKDHKDFDSVKYVDIVDDLNAFSESRNLGINLSDILSNLGDKVVDAESIVSISAIKKDEYKFYRLTTKREELNEYLISQDNITLEHLGFVKYLKDDYDLDKFVNELYSRIADQANNYEYLRILFARLKDLVDSPLTITLSDAELYSLFTTMPPGEEFYYDLIAIRLSKTDLFNSSYISGFTSVLQSDEQSYAIKIADCIGYYVSLDKFLIGAETFNDSPLYLNIAEIVIDGGYKNFHGEIRNILLKFESICENLNIDPLKFLVSLDNFIVTDEEINPVIDFPNYLFDNCLRSETNLSKIILKNADNYFLSLNKEEWSKLFDNINSSNYLLLNIINYEKWNNNSKEGFKLSLIKTIREQNFDNVSDWSAIIYNHEKSNLKVTNTLKDIRDILYNDGTLVTNEVFKLLMVPFLTNSVLIDRPGESFRVFFKPEFFDNPEITDLIIQYSSDINKLLELSKPEDFEDFKQAIRDRISENDLLKDLAKLFNIRDF